MRDATVDLPPCGTTAQASRCPYRHASRRICKANLRPARMIHASRPKRKASSCDGQNYGAASRSVSSGNKLLDGAERPGYFISSDTGTRVNDGSAAQNAAFASAQGFYTTMHLSVKVSGESFLALGAPSPPYHWLPNGLSGGHCVFHSAALYSILRQPEPFDCRVETAPG